jgi:Flp pilus assembly protein TadG
MRNLITGGMRDERGAAVVEFAIVATVLVPLMLYSLYFVDLAKARLKTAEIARYAVWEMTSYPLSDYANKNHDGFFNTAAGQVRDDIRTRYSDDLRGDTVNATYKPWVTVDYRLQQVEFVNQEARLVPNPEAYNSPGGEVVSSILNAISGGINDVVGFWGFNKKGQAKVTVRLRTDVRREVVPRQFAQDFYDAEMLPNTASSLTFTDSFTMIVDSWTLLDGDDVYPWGGYSKGGTDSLYYKQLSRVVWLGAANIPILGSIGNLMNKLNSWFGNFVDLNPFQARVASIASKGPANMANDIKVNVDCGETEMHTTPIRETFGGPTASEYGKTYNKRGSYYMGCPQPEKKPGECGWQNNNP